MLIRNPQAEASTQPAQAESTEELVKQLETQLREGSADTCIELLSTWPQLPQELRRLMLKRLLTESDVRVQQVFMNHLLPGLQEEELRLLLDQFTGEDASLRNQIIDGLSQVSEEQQKNLLLPELQKRLSEGSRDTRILTLNLITWLENPALLPAVEALLAEEEDINVCMTALEALPVLDAGPELAVLDAVAERFHDEPYARFALQNIRRQLGSSPTSGPQNKEA
ncbi:hypothetical protein [Marinospirillum sp.]|uniref:hypothetical protein n=1 Tax=Marinospirillum sp. TaxID=2183934 RepID=UPI0038508747